MNYLITGGTGFIGSYVRSVLLQEGHSITVLTRNPDKYNGEQATNQRFISWERDLVPVMDETDVVLNLAGENLFGKRWTDSIKRKIYQSRILITRKLVDTMEAAAKKPALFISASGISYYGDNGSILLDESDEPGTDFLADVCKDWENEAQKAKSLGIRVVNPRIGITLQSDGGMLQIMKLPFLLFIGGPIGGGKQFIPWIHMDDLCNALLFPVKNEKLEGPYNACSPNPATMNDFARTIGKVMNRPSFLRVPEFLLKLVLGEAATPALSSLNTRPRKLEVCGFGFEFEDLEEALADVL